MEVERLTPYIGTIVLVLVTASFIAFSGNIPAASPPAHTTANASSTVSVVPGFTLPAVTLPKVAPEAEPVSPVSAPTVPGSKKSTPTVTSKSPATIVAAAPAPTPSTPAPSSSSSSALLSSTEIALRDALVNIICYAPVGSGLRSISGSGVVVDPKGIILTNAHVAQYFLLTHRGISCSIRTGSPATDRYTASLMYISPKWVYANADLLTQTNPVGTGQYDFALLAVTGSANSAALPPIFPSVSLSTESPSIGTPVTIASYGAQYLPPSQIKSGLFPTIVSDTVRDVFTYAVNSVDIFELGGSAAAQEGSSGGGVVNDKGSLVGMLTTSSLDANTSIRTLDAITASYIRAEYVDETGQSLDSLFDQSPTVTVAGFSSRVPALEALINAHLP